ncbi:MAG UNVERIFIED_CONTAM: hypothetical protein LVQ98_07490 [Rickettsiaceae bacterium]
MKKRQRCSIIKRGSLVQHQDNILPNNVLGEFNMVFNNNGALSLVTPKHTLGELLVQEPLAALSGAASRLGLHLKYFCNPTKVGIDFFKLQSAIKQSVGDTHPSHLQQIISAITEAGDAASQVLLAFVLGGGVAIGGAVGSNNPDNADNYQPDSTLFYGGGGGSGGDRYEPVIIVALSQANEDFLDQVRKVFAYLTVMLSAEGMHLKQYALCEGAAKNEELVAPTEAVAPVVTEAVASVGPVGVVLDFPTSMWI